MIQHCVDANIDEAYKVGLLPLVSMGPQISSVRWRSLWETSPTLKVTGLQVDFPCFAHRSARTGQKLLHILGPAWQEGMMGSWWWEHVALLFLNMHEYFAFM